ncbi:MAG TPA: ABC transporter permease [Kofleriaceae bacterium]|nr:ABC transporter permease [Kofleriaceae bacterium]
MRNLFYILQKEFLLIFRDRTILRMIFFMPLVQLVLIPMAADYEVKGISLAVVDHDHSTTSRRLVDRLNASSYFDVVATPDDYQGGVARVERDLADLVVTIPADFDRDLTVSGRSSVQLAADAVNGVRAGLGVAYATAMIRQFQGELLAARAAPGGPAPPVIDISSASWFNPHVRYPMFMVPGILAILVTMVGALLSALNIVMEKESGTIEQINVTPIRKSEFILGKLIPFWVLGLVSITLGMVVARFVYHLMPVGAFLTIYVFAAVYLVGVLGVGLFISTISEHQQQATLFSFFVMMVFILLGGLYTPIESMPGWARWIAAFNPPAYFIEIIRAVYIKGSTIADLLPSLVRLIGFAFAFNALAVWSYRKRTA